MVFAARHNLAEACRCLVARTSPDGAALSTALWAALDAGARDAARALDQAGAKLLDREQEALMLAVDPGCEDENMDAVRCYFDCCNPDPDVWGALLHCGACADNLDVIRVAAARTGGACVLSHGSDALWEAGRNANADAVSELLRLGAVHDGNLLDSVTSISSWNDEDPDGDTVRTLLPMSGVNMIRLRLSIPSFVTV